MSDAAVKKRFSDSFYSIILVGIWWGEIEALQLVWSGKPAYFTWERYFAAWIFLTFFSLFFISVIVVPLSVLFKRRWRAENSWAVSLMAPTTLIGGIKLMMRIFTPSPRWAPNIKDLWFLPIVLPLLLGLMFILIRSLIKFLWRFKLKKAVYLITISLTVLLLIMPIRGNPHYGATSSSRQNMPDIILITLDTVRADHLATYGYFRQTTPFLDKLASESVVFDNTAVQINHTPGSHISILTSRYPSEIGTTQVASSFDPKYDTLEKELKEKGYYTAAFLSSIALKRTFTKTLGFDLYDDVFSFYSWISLSDIITFFEFLPLNKLYNKLRVYPQIVWRRNAEETTKTVLKWMEKYPADKPLFLWVHYFDPHEPLNPPPPYDKQFNPSPEQTKFIEDRINLAKVEKFFKMPPEIFYEKNNLYDGEMAFMDHWIEKLFEGIAEKRDRFNQSYIIVVADHGYSWGEHNYVGKFEQIYDTIIKVPLFIHMPDKVGHRIDAQVEGVDIMPTVLDLLNIKIPPDLRGTSLLPLIRGESVKPRPAFSETVAYPVKYSVRTKDWKLIFRTNAKVPLELYNLADDPLEKTNLSQQPNIFKEPQIKELMQQLSTWIRKYHKTQNIKMPPLTNSDVQVLRSLGYIQ